MLDRLLYRLEGHYPPRVPSSIRGALEDRFPWRGDVKDGYVQRFILRMQPCKVLPIPSVIPKTSIHQHVAPGPQSRSCRDFRDVPRLPLHQFPGLLGHQLSVQAILREMGAYLVGINNNVGLEGEEGFGGQSLHRVQLSCSLL